MLRYILASLILVTACAAQQKRVSPHEQVSATVGGQKITIDYGRPYMKGRKIFGGLEPYGKVWRAGADEATKLTTTGDLMIGNVHVPKGSYSLFVLPEEKGWTLIVNSVADQWGAFKYDQSKDIGRTPMTATKGGPTEQWTIALEPQGKGATLRMAWENTVATIPITVH
jgi:Protein of unknown function (DUF2911)